MPLKSLSSIALILTLMMCMRGEVSCNETHRTSPVIDINLQYQANNDPTNSSYGCPTLLAKMTADASIQSFISLSRTKHSFSNIMICTDKSCLHTPYVSK